jgi:hypothetical protein
MIILPCRDSEMEKGLPNELKLQTRIPFGAKFCFVFSRSD